MNINMHGFLIGTTRKIVAVVDGCVEVRRLADNQCILRYRLLPDQWDAIWRLFEAQSIASSIAVKELGVDKVKALMLPKPDGEKT